MPLKKDICTKFIDTSGKLRSLRGCSVTNLDEFVDTVAIICDKLNQSSQETFTDVYVNDLIFRQLCDLALKLCHIDPTWVNLSMLAELLLPHRVGDEIKSGLLEQLSLPAADSSERSESIVSVAEYTASVLTGLVKSGLTENLQQSIDIADKLTATEINTMFESLPTVEEKEKPAPTPANPSRPTAPPGRRSFEGWDLK